MASWQPHRSLQGFANLAVPAEPLLCGEVSIQCVADGHLGETVLPCCGEDGHDSLGCNRTIECMHELRMRRTCHACERFHIKGTPHHTGKSQEVLAGGRQGVHPQPNRFAHALGQHRRLSACGVPSAAVLPSVMSSRTISVRKNGLPSVRSCSDVTTVSAGATPVISARKCATSWRESPCKWRRCWVGIRASSLYACVSGWGGSRARSR